MLYAAPQPVMLGDRTEPDEIADYLRRTGYTESNRNRLGWYHERPDAVEINPGPEAYDNKGAVIKINHGKVTEIISPRDAAHRVRSGAGPITICATRSAVALGAFADIPGDGNAALSAEDKHFFQHAGFDPIGILRDYGGHRGAPRYVRRVDHHGNWRGPCGWGRNGDGAARFPETLITMH
jgi:penicillin-binding protein 1B